MVSPSQIQIFDVAAPQSPVQLGAFESPFCASCGCIIDQRLYLGLFSYDAEVRTKLVEVFDIRDPSHPVSLGRLTLPGLPHARELLVAGQKQLLALLGKSVALIDISDPARLKLIGKPLSVPAYTGVIMPWGNRKLLITGAAAVSVTEDELKLEGWLPGRGTTQHAASEGDLAIIPSALGAYVFQVRPPP